MDDDGNVNAEAEELVMNEVRRSFRPEFLNRLDEILMFKPLTKEGVSSIVDILMDELNERLVDRELRVELTDAAKQFVVDNGYDATYGARPLKRYLQRNVETLAAKKILEGNLSVDTTMTVDVVDGALTIL